MTDSLRFALRFKGFLELRENIFRGERHLLRSTPICKHFKAGVETPTLHVAKLNVYEGRSSWKCQEYKTQSVQEGHWYTSSRFALHSCLQNISWDTTTDIVAVLTWKGRRSSLHASFTFFESECFLHRKFLQFFSPRSCKNSDITKTCEIRI